jgi:hypothetical protein
MSSAGTLCFDSFSPAPGDSEVISQVERLSSNETKISPRSARMALGASGRSALTCMAVSRVGVRNFTLPERRSLPTSRWDLPWRFSNAGSISARSRASVKGRHPKTFTKADVSRAQWRTPIKRLQFFARPVSGRWCISPAA